MNTTKQRKAKADMAVLELPTRRTGSRWLERRAGAALAVFVLLVGGCGSSPIGTSASTTAEPDTSTAAADESPAQPEAEPDADPTDTDRSSDDTSEDQVDSADDHDDETDDGLEDEHASGDDHDDDADDASEDDHASGDDHDDQTDDGLEDDHASGDDHDDQADDASGDEQDDRSDDDGADGKDPTDDDGDGAGGTEGSTTVAPDDAVDVASVGRRGELLAVGSYQVDVLGQGFRLDVDEDDAVLFVGSGADNLALLPVALRDDPTYFGILKIVGILPPREAGTHQAHDPAIPEVTIDVPPDLTTWFDATPQVAVVANGSTIVAGEPARWWDLTVDPAAGATFPCAYGDQCAGFVVMPSGVTTLAPGLSVRVWQLDAIPDVMPWAQSEDPALFEPAQQTMAQLLDGISAV